MKKIFILVILVLSINSCKHMNDSIKKNQSEISKLKSETKNSKSDRDLIYLKIGNMEAKKQKSDSLNSRSLALMNKKINSTKDDINILYKKIIQIDRKQLRLSTKINKKPVVDRTRIPLKKANTIVKTTEKTNPLVLSKLKEIENKLLQFDKELGSYKSKLASNSSEMNKTNLPVASGTINNEVVEEMQKEIKLAKEDRDRIYQRLIMIGNQINEKNSSNTISKDLENSYKSAQKN